MAKWFPGRKLSWVRVCVLVIVVGLLGAGGAYAWARASDERIAAAHEPWTDAYVDVTAMPAFPFERVSDQEGASNVVLSFIVAAPDDACTPTWGSAYSLDEAQEELDLDRRLAQLRTVGGSAMVSFGGEANSDLAVGCRDHDDLTAGYAAVVDRYEVGTIDMDIEGDLLADAAAVKRQAEAIAEVQADSDVRGNAGLDVWLTLPVAPDGLTSEGQSPVRAYLRAGVDLAGVNAMTMNYNQDGGESLLTRVTGSLTALHGQVRALFNEADIDLGTATAWSRVAATPMIGQNEVRGEVFSLDDARALNAFANQKGMQRLSMWSLNRDRTCDDNWPDVRVVSDACSGVSQGSERFVSLLSADRDGGISRTERSESPVVDDDALVDDPETSPYPIWNEEAAYPAQTKVVWHRSVYEAKWWTEGEQPDVPGEDGTAPWRLIGPVLPGETPIAQPELPAGTYPEWQQDATYQQGDRVMLEDRGYIAKWWTSGDSPDAALVVPQESPWRPMTDAEVAQVADE